MHENHGRFENVSTSIVNYKSLTRPGLLIESIEYLCNHIFFFSDGSEHPQYIIGLVGDVLVVCFFGAPVASLSHLMCTRSTEVLPFPIILSSWFVTGQ